MMLPATSQQVLDPDLAAAVAAAVQERWAALPKTGKPQPNEHTVLAGEFTYHDDSVHGTCLCVWACDLIR